MKCSIIIPAYNTETTLENTINSILHSGMPDYEIIIVDDGSLDHTPELCDYLASLHPAVCCIHQENNGVSAARNRGLQEAKGDYIWFFDSDDLVDPGSMKRAMQVIDERRPDMLMFGMSFDYYHGKRMYQRLELYYDAEIEMTPEDIEDAFLELHHDNMLTPCWNKIIKRSVLLENKVQFDPALFSMEDFQFSLNALQFCKSVYILPQAIYRFTQQDDRLKMRHGRDNKRMARIPNIAEYLKMFEPFLTGHPDVLVALYYTMLSEKLSVKRPSEMGEIADRFCSGPYSSDLALNLCTQGQKDLAAKLKNRQFRDIYINNLKSNIKSALVKMVKRTPVYKLLRGSTTKKVRF